GTGWRSPSPGAPSPWWSLRKSMCRRASTATGWSATAGWSRTRSGRRRPTPRAAPANRPPRGRTRSPCARAPSRPELLWRRGRRLRMVRGCKDGSRVVRRRAPGQATSPEGVTAMDRTALRQALCEILEEETGRTYIALGEGTDLRAGLGLDSVDMVSLVIHLQTRFRIQIT